VGSIDFQIKSLSGFGRPNERAQLLPPEAYQMVSQLLSNPSKRRKQISTVYIIKQI
jgi:hypothetical protein